MRRDSAATLSASDFAAFSVEVMRASTTGSVTGARGVATARSRLARRAEISSIDLSSAPVIALGSTLAGAGRAARSFNCFSIAAKRGVRSGCRGGTGGVLENAPNSQSRRNRAKPPAAPDAPAMTCGADAPRKPGGGGRWSGWGASAARGGSGSCGGGGSNAKRS